MFNNNLQNLICNKIISALKANRRKYFSFDTKDHEEWMHPMQS